MKARTSIALTSLIAPLLLVLLVTPGCKDLTCFSVTGDVVDRPYWIADINSLEMHCEGEVFLASGDSQSVVLRSDEQLFKVLQFHITNGKLIMEFSEDCVEDIGRFELYITTTQDFQTIDLRSSGTVVASDSLQATNLTVKVSGSGGVTLSEAHSETMDLQVSGSGNIIVGAVDTLNSSVNRITGSGDIRTFNVISRDVMVNSSGSGNMEVHAIDTLHGSITGSGNVRYKGQPGIDVSETGSGQLVDAN